MAERQGRRLRKGHRRRWWEVAGTGTCPISPKRMKNSGVAPGSTKKAAEPFGDTKVWSCYLFIPLHDLSNSNFNSSVVTLKGKDVKAFLMALL